MCDLGTSKMRRLKLIKGCKCRIEEEEERRPLVYTELTTRFARPVLYYTVLTNSMITTAIWMQQI
jgi:hypothetical protein